MEPLIESVKLHMEGQLSGLEKVGDVKIKKVEGVTTLTIKDMPKEKDAYSGDDFEINPTGWARVQERLKENSWGYATVKFYVKLKCRYNAKAREFEVTETNNFVPFRDNP